MELFFGYPERIIKEDHGRAMANPKEVLKQLTDLPKSIPPTPETEASWTHLSLILANWAWQSGNVVGEVAAFHAILPAEQIAEAAGSVALEKGKLREISQNIDAIRTREGLEENEFWPIGHGPLDYQDQESQFEHQFDKIFDTVIVFVLNRYGLHELANLFDQDRTQFEIKREIGRRVFTDEDGSDLVRKWDAFFAKEHGSDALAKVKIRVAEILSS